MNPISKMFRRAALWLVFRAIPVDHPDAQAFVKSRMAGASQSTEDKITIERALECYYWIRRIVK